jgi:hypothetical protein
MRENFCESQGQCESSGLNRANICRATGLLGAGIARQAPTAGDTARNGSSDIARWSIRDDVTESGRQRNSEASGRGSWRNFEEFRLVISDL